MIQYCFRAFKIFLNNISDPILYNEVGNKKKKDYQVVGVYKTEYVNNIKSNYQVYTNYMENDFLDLFLKY